MIGVLDGNALIAFLRDEPGSAVVEGLLLDPTNSNFAHQETFLVSRQGSPRLQPWGGIGPAD
jgi:hypothetical protein